MILFGFFVETALTRVSKSWKRVDTHMRKKNYHGPDVSWAMVITPPCQDVTD